MIYHDKQLARLAVALHDQLQAGLNRTVPVVLPVSTWQRCETLQRRMQLAHQRGWQRTFHRLRRHLSTVLSQLQIELTGADRSLANIPSELKVQKSHDIYRDLIALREEFDGVTIDRQTNTVSIRTEAIELQDIYLGEFEIQLDLHNLTTGQLLSYRVVALDPHPSSTNDCVTHPHVQDESLCEGEGNHAIRRALQQGRLLDFFVIVANLLRTYNSASPFVSLAAWNGLECPDCGTSVSEDDQSSCEKCDTVVCSPCRYFCPPCGCSYCSECISRCEDCDEPHCHDCLTLCTRCQTETCRACLDDKERCSHCHDQEIKDKQPQADSDGGTCPATGLTKVHSHRLGEASVSP